MYFCYFVLILNCWCVSGQLGKGDKCTKDGYEGSCSHLKDCSPAKVELAKKKSPQICSFVPSNPDPLVCCVDATATPVTPQVTITTSKPISTTEAKETAGATSKPKTSKPCPPIDRNLTSARTGQKAWDKCLEYQEKYVYPCEKSTALLGGNVRVNRCKHKADELIFGGENAAENEFPHMALLGYGEDLPTVKWSCGGTIISEFFILTAAHCISDSRNTPVSYAIVGTLKRMDPDRIDKRKLHKISQIIKHDNYHAPEKYNDIALLRTERIIELSSQVVPACLHVGDKVDDEKALVTGWGFIDKRSTVADILQKVIISKYTIEECRPVYSQKKRLLSRNIDGDIQLCYGDRNNENKDTCKGDSGGPLQIKSKAMHCMYTIIGVTSFGNSCGRDPGIYTRVAAYAKWIEDIVWP